MLKCQHEYPGNCFYANHRSTVYAVLEQLLASGMVEELRVEGLTHICATATMRTWSGFSVSLIRRTAGQNVFPSWPSRITSGSKWAEELFEQVSRRRPTAIFRNEQLCAATRPTTAKRKEKRNRPPARKWTLLEHKLAQ